MACFCWFSVCQGDLFLLVSWNKVEPSCRVSRETPLSPNTRRLPGLNKLRSITEMVSRGTWVGVVGVVSLLSELSRSTWNTVGLIGSRVGCLRALFFSVSCWWLVFHVEQLWLWVWGCCWELEMGLLMECFTWNVEVCLGWFVGISCCGFERWNRISLTVEWADLSCWRMVGVSRETWWVVGVYLVAVFHVEHG